MPTYDYICSNCGRTSEIVHSINGSPPGACPACGAVGTLRKAFNPPTIHFKGSGWAKKDRSSGHSRPARAESASTNGTGSDGSSESNHGHDGDSGGDSRGEPAPTKGASKKEESDKGSSDKGSSDKESSKTDRSRQGSPAASSSNSEAD
jgi:putative FmdB family regulatory protein